MDRFPCAEHLNLEEVDYELAIRDRLGDVARKLELPSKQRILRTIFREDLSQRRNYQASDSVSDYFCHIGEQLSSIERSIQRKKMDAKSESRLLHYWYRSKRLQATSEDQKKMRRDLVRRIESVMSANRVVLPATPVKEQIRDLLTQNAGPSGNTSMTQSQTGSLRNSLGAIQKEGRPSGDNKPSDAVTERLGQMEDMMKAMLALMADQEGGMHGVNFDGVSTPTKIKHRQRNDDRFDRRRAHHSDSEDESEEERSMLSSDADSRISDFGRRGRHTGSEPETHRSSRRRTQLRERGDHLYRVEKWKIKFSGDPRSLSVEDFLYKANKLAEREGIPKERLLGDIHLLLEDSASDWFFTYVDNFDTWEQFEKQIKCRFGNPNKDQGIRQKIKDRKQQRGESFASFVTEIEKLNRMLTRPMSRRAKFEAIWDNMRHHYQSKVSVVDINSLEELIRINRKIDATDLSLQNSWEPQSKRPVNNVEVGEDSEKEFSEEGEFTGVNALNSRPFRQNTNQAQPHSRTNQKSISKQTNYSSRDNNSFQTIIYPQHRPVGIVTKKVMGGEIAPNRDKCPHIRVHVFDTEIDALLDSGAAISVTNSSEMAEKYGLKILPAAVRVSTADGTEYRCLGYLNLPYKYKEITKIIPTLIVPQISRKLILGADFWESFGIRPMIDIGNGPETIETLNAVTDALICFNIEPSGELPKLTQNEPDKTLDVPTFDPPEEPVPENIETEHDLSDHERCELIEAVKDFEFTAPGKLGRTHLIEHEIILKDDAKPRNQPIYKCSPYIQREIDAEIERFKELGAIEECYSEWTNPLVPVRKSNGKIRVCLDSRRINSMTIKDSYPMQNMQDIFHRLESAKFFSIIDLKDAYFQIPLKEESRNYTAFRTSKGLFRFKVCPFGVTNAPFTMCRLMGKALGFDLQPQVFVYLDDIVIATKTLTDHLRLLREVAKRLRNAGLTISLEKSRFCRKQVMYLGYLLTEHGVQIDQSRIQPILNYARPKSVKDVRRLMGLAGFYQRFIPNYSRITANITDLLKKEKKFSWTPEAELSFQELKTVLTSAPVLANPDFEKQFMIESDASDNAVGAALVQMQEGETRVIGYFSKKLSATQRKYSAVEKECLGVLLAIDNFKHYVEGTRFKVVTDARSLLWLFKIGAESGNSKLLRWALRIQSFDIELEYRKGKNNITADCLSRSIDALSLESDVEYQELVKDVTFNPGKYHDFRVINGEIWKYVKSSNHQTDPRFTWKRYPPSSERKDLIQQEHEKGHFGYEKTLAALKERYHWPKMNAEVRKFCRQCLACQTSKAVNINTTPPMGSQKPVEYPWQFVTLDFVGPLPASGKNRATCLLVATDVFSKFVLVQPFREAKAGPLSEFVENMIFRLFGVPEIILTDNGTQFTSKTFTDLLKEYHVNHWLTPAYHPQVNNTERVNRVITTAIRATLKKEHKHWADDIQAIANAIRTAVHNSTKYSPYFVVFGRNQISDGREYAQIRDKVQGEERTDESVSKDRQKLFEEVRENLTAAYKRHEKTYNLRSNENCPRFIAGEKVLKKTFELSDKAKGFCRKLAPKFEPCVIAGGIDLPTPRTRRFKERITLSVRHHQTTQQLVVRFDRRAYRRSAKRHTRDGHPGVIVPPYWRTQGNFSGKPSNFRKITGLSSQPNSSAASHSQACHHSSVGSVSA
ncbi:uncharacterized protein LOC129737961 [Uranotaenia lowii]|uniref:uncharacterized protein LOC129737961 n=1 Tax=Uranotaenia lowii TaxID=190385 RepID=UPI002479AEF2|nr:uncharacterized protein LOC129737961 [Uranotaenia lowii]